MSQDWINEILKEVSQRYGIRADKLEKIGGGFENEYRESFENIRYGHFYYWRLVN